MIIIVILLFSSGNGYTQPVSIQVRDAERQPLPGAAVRLVLLADSSARSTFTNAEGIAIFDPSPQGVYHVKITFVSYQDVEKTIAVRSDRREFSFQLTDRVNQLGSATITASRPMIRQEDDKMIIDPEPMANTSTNTLEVLESTPGLFVDPDGGIYLNSATPAAVYINGREQKMSNQDINTILRSLPPGSVLRIEVMRTPSARYDATSSGGIINIVLKKGVKIGRFGTLNAGMNQGFYGNHHSGITLNDSRDKSTLYLNVNYNYHDMLEEINALRELGPDTTLQQTAKTRNRNHQGYLGYGISYDPKDNLNLSYDGRISLSSKESNTSSNNQITSIGKILLMESNNQVHNQTGFASIQQDLGMILKTDTTGSEWDTRLGYTFNSGSTFQDYLNVFRYPLATSLEGGGDNLQNRHFLLFQSDLTQHLPLKIKLETGIKSTWQSFSSKADFYTLQQEKKVNDTLRTNSYRHSENINAAYVQVSRELWAGFLLKAGVRLEHTLMNGHQTIPNDTSFVVNRTDWFPYVYLSRKILDVAGFEVRGYMIYRKTINRPGYQSLNPSIRIIDPFLYETGNPGLTPQFTDNYEINISINDMPLFALGRNDTRDIFSSVVYQDEKQEHIAVRTFDNLGKNRETYFRAMGGIPPGKKYFFALGAQYNLNEYDGIYDNHPWQYQRGGWRFFTFHSLNLFRETRITMFGFLLHKGSYNFYELKTFGALNFGIHQTFLNKRLTVTLHARDVFRTMVTGFELNQGSIITSGDRYADNQRFGINIRYNFGIKTKEEKRESFGMDMEE